MSGNFYGYGYSSIPYGMPQFNPYTSYGNQFMMPYSPYGAPSVAHEEPKDTFVSEYKGKDDTAGKILGIGAAAVLLGGAIACLATHKKVPKGNKNAGKKIADAVDDTIKGVAKKEKASDVKIKTPEIKIDEQKPQVKEAEVKTPETKTNEITKNVESKEKNNTENSKETNKNTQQSNIPETKEKERKGIFSRISNIFKRKEKPNIQKPQVKGPEIKTPNADTGLQVQPQAKLKVKVPADNNKVGPVIPETSLKVEKDGFTGPLMPVSPTKETPKNIEKVLAKSPTVQNPSVNPFKQLIDEKPIKTLLFDNGAKIELFNNKTLLNGKTVIKTEVEKGDLICTLENNSKVTIKNGAKKFNKYKNS